MIDYHFRCVSWGRFEDSFHVFGLDDVPKHQEDQRLCDGDQGKDWHLDVLNLIAQEILFAYWGLVKDKELQGEVEARKSDKDEGPQYKETLESRMKGCNRFSHHGVKIVSLVFWKLEGVLARWSEKQGGSDEREYNESAWECESWNLEAIFSSVGFVVHCCWGSDQERNNGCKHIAPFLLLNVGLSLLVTWNHDSVVDDAEAADHLIEGKPWLNAESRVPHESAPVSNVHC